MQKIHSGEIFQPTVGHFPNTDLSYFKKIGGSIRSIVEDQTRSDPESIQVVHSSDRFLIHTKRIPDLNLHDNPRCTME